MKIKDLKKDKNNEENNLNQIKKLSEEKTEAYIKRREELRKKFFRKRQIKELDSLSDSDFEMNEANDNFLNRGPMNMHDYFTSRHPLD